MNRTKTAVSKQKSDDIISKAKTHKSNKIFLIKKIKKQKKWTSEEDELLIKITKKYKEKNWKQISKYFTKKNSLQCFSRYKRIRPGIMKGTWKKEEDLKIIELINKYGKVWSKISKILGFRNGKQIRDRYINVLNPETKKGKFTEDEDNKLINLYKQHGPKWATIAKYFSDRTADLIKNRFNSFIKKKYFINDIGNIRVFKDCGKTKKEIFQDCVMNHQVPTPTTNTLSIQSTQNDSNSNSRKDSFANISNFQDFEPYIDHKNFNTSNKEFESDYALKTNHLKCSILNNEKVYYNENAECLIWNFDDYFSI